MMLPSRSTLAATFLLLPLVWSDHENTNPNYRRIKILNESGRPVEVNWMNTATQSRTRVSNPEVLDGGEMPLNTYVMHTFEIKELPSKTTGECQEDRCKTAYFTVNHNKEQVIKVTKDFLMKHEDSKSVARDVATSVLEPCNSLKKVNLLEKYTECVQSIVEKRLLSLADEIGFEAHIRTELAKRWENYTCADDDLETSDAVKKNEWEDPKDGKVRNVHVMHTRPSSQIHVIEDFISEEECQAMEVAAAPKLARAEVADGKGGSTKSDARKAWQAGITVPWDQEQEGHAIPRLSRRVLDYANHALDLDFQEHGQEPLMSIQYFGQGQNASQADQYLPHCDGPCLGDPHQPGARVATMVVYCTVPTRGGATNFRNSGVHVKPVKGNAIFFSYIDPESLVTDSGFTEHSGCPVLEGEKKIVTQWIRLGVDKENPWSSFDTLNLKIKPSKDD